MVNTANYIRNRCPTKSLDGSIPYEAWIGNKPDIRHLREFGCKLLCLDNDSIKGKLAPRSKEELFLGYSQQSKGYRVWISKEIISRDVKFLEDRDNRTDKGDVSAPEISSEHRVTRPVIEVETDVTSKTHVNHDEEIISEDDDSGTIHSTDEDLPEDTHDEAEEGEATTSKRGPGRSKIIRTGLRGRPRKLFHEPRESANSTAEYYAFLAEVPLKRAMSGPDAAEWREAMIFEVKSVIGNDTWEVVTRPADHHIIGSRMVLKNKYRSDGSVEKRKARMIAQGFSQRPGVHFNETFAPVARISSIRLMMALAARYEMNIQQLDVTTAYLNGTSCSCSHPKCWTNALDPSQNRKRTTTHYARRPRRCY